MRTPPDSNVRTARPPAAASARGVGRFTLARLLLGFGAKLLVLAAVSSSMPACIIPVAPEWQDPPGDPNAAPEILNPEPDFGAEVTATTSKTFQFYVTDPNVSQDLYLQLVIDDSHRGVIQDSVRHNDNGTPIHALIMPTVACFDVNQNVARHSIKAGVADSPFATGDQFLTVMDPAGLKNVITWTLNLNCQASPMP